MDDLESVIEKLKQELGEDKITTASDPKIKRPEKALERDMYKDFMDRNPLAGGGMLVQPGFGGVRQGYAKDDKSPSIRAPRKTDESYRKVVKNFVATSGPGTGSVFDDPAAIDIVKAELNRIKKQRNNKNLFEWSEKSDWYKNLQKRLNPNTKKGLNREFTNKLINQVVDEFFPDAYHGKDAIKNFRNDMVVKSFIQHLKSVGEFDGQEKFDPVLDQFTYKKDGKRKDADHLYESINKSWNEWRQGKFEVNGVDRAQLKKELKARGIDYSQINKWKASAAQGRGTAKIKQIKFLDNQNSKFPNRNAEQVKALFKKQFPDGNFELRVNELTQLKRNGVYVSGNNSEKGITGISKGDRADWLKKTYGKQFAGNYSKIINAADQLAAAGETAKAERLYRAADKFFGPKGLIRKSAIGEAEHALARSFDFLNPDRQLAINSIVDGDLNQFKKNLFDIPVKKHFDEYNNPNTTKARRVELKNLIENRKKVMNALTGGQKSGIVAGDIVSFRYGPTKITATSSVKPIDILFKEGKFNIDDYISRGSAYGESFKTTASKLGIIDETGKLTQNFSTPVTETQTKQIAANLRKLGFKCKFAASSGGVGSCDDPMSYVDDIKKQENLLKVQKINSPSAVRTLNTARKLNAARSLFTSTLGPGALAFEAVAALPIAYMGYKGGKTPENIIADATFNLIGKSDKRVFLDKAVEMGFNTANIKRAQDLLKKQEAFEKQDARADEFMGPDDMFMYPQMVQKAERDLLDVTKQFIDPKTGQVIPERVAAFDQLPLVEQGVAKDQADLATKRQEQVGGFLQSPVADYLPNFAGGGIAGLSGGIDKGPQIRSMNPDSQGLSGLLKRDIKG